MSEEKAYAIVDWHEHFENAQSRRCDKVSWVPVPNKHDGKGYKRIAKLPDACQVFSAWVLLLQVASKTPVRGVLSDEDGPLTAEDLELMTEFPAEIFERAFQVLVNGRIRWLKCGALSALILDSTSRARAEQKEQKEQNRKNILFDPATEKLGGVTETDKQTWKEAYPACNITTELKRMEVWLVANPTKRKKNYRRFITNWLARNQERGGTRGSTRSHRGPNI